MIKSLSRRGRWLLLAVLLQPVLLLGLWGSALWPILTGTEVVLEVRPVDPRDLFRGQYVRLDYAVADLPQDPSSAGAWHVEQQVYVYLAPDELGIWQQMRVTTEPPRAGEVALKGRLKHHWRGLRPEFGLEAWFASEEQALAIERELSSGALAVVRVASDGRARLVELRTPSGTVLSSPAGR